MGMILILQNYTDISSKMIKWLIYSMFNYGSPQHLIFFWDLVQCLLELYQVRMSEKHNY